MFIPFGSVITLLGIFLLEIIRNVAKDFCIICLLQHDLLEIGTNWNLNAQQKENKLLQPYDKNYVAVEKLCFSLKLAGGLKYLDNHSEFPRFPAWKVGVAWVPLGTYFLSFIDCENQAILRVGMGGLKPSPSSVFASLGAFGVHIFFF